MQKTINEKMLMEATISLGAKSGLENIRTSTIASEAGVSEGSIYKFYPSKDKLIVDSFLMICDDIDNMMLETYDPTLEFWDLSKKMWFAYYDYFVTNPHKAKYFNRFRYSAFMTQEVNENHMKHFKFFMEFIDSNIKGTLGKLVDGSVIWSFVVDSTISLAAKANDGFITIGEEEKEQAYNMLVKMFK